MYLSNCLAIGRSIDQPINAPTTFDKKTPDQSTR